MTEDEYRAAVGDLLAAATPFADFADDIAEEDTDEQQVWPTFTIGEFRAIRAAVAKLTGGRA